MGPVDRGGCCESRLVAAAGRREVGPARAGAHGRQRQRRPRICCVRPADLRLRTYQSRSRFALRPGIAAGGQPGKQSSLGRSSERNGPDQRRLQLVYGCTAPIASVDAWWLFYDLATGLDIEIRTARDYLDGRK